MESLARQLSASATVFNAAYRGRRPSTVGRPVNRCVEDILGLGLGVEIWLAERRFSHMTPETLEALRETLKAAHPVTAHSDQARWKPERLREEIRLAAYLGAKALVVHPGTLALEESEPPSEGELRDMFALAHDLGLVIALENSGRRGIDALRGYLDLIGGNPGQTGLGFCIDTGHAHRGMLLDGVAVVDYLTEFRSVIVEVHVNDNEGAADLHLPPGEGTIDWRGVMGAIRALPDETVVCVEITSPDDPVRTLAKAKEFILETTG